ncbi:MAG: YibE/F family protein, partial [Candidatus Sericytochromatia bacterium]|nr:YibE/F family protein [Candidatus Sericytochromatia bacterium]
MNLNLKKQLLKYNQSKYFLVLVFILSMFIYSCSSNNSESYTEAKVINVISSLTVEDKNSNIENQSTKILVKVLSGVDKDKEVVINQQSPNNPNNIGIPESGDIVILSESILSTGDSALQIVDVRRSNITLLAIVFFIVCLCAIGGIKGLIFAGLLFFIFLLVVFVLFPLISYGLSPLILTFVFACFVSGLINFFTANSKEKLKMIILSNVCSLFIVTIFAYIFAKAGAFGSLLAKESINIFSQEISAGGFIASAIILTSLGGIINVGISTFNLNKDVRKAKPKAHNNEIFYSTLKFSRPSVFINFLFIFM